MRINAAASPRIRTHEGASAIALSPAQQLRRAACSCLLWEGTFYEDGADIADRIRALVQEVEPAAVAALAVEAREKMKLRHAPLWLVLAMLDSRRHKPLVRRTLAAVVQRPDELAETLALWWKDGKRPIPKQLQRGLADAFGKFTASQLAKYKGRGDPISLRDAMFLTHPKPADDQAETYRALASDTLPTPDTWETALSSGADKRATFERLIAEGRLGALAVLRNLRNMSEAHVEPDLIRAALGALDVARVLPYRFIAAARYAPEFEPELEAAMFRAVGDLPKLPGHTVLLLDVSGSMIQPLSAKSQVARMDAACGLAVLARELCERVAIYTFSNALVQVPGRRGFALRDAVIASQLNAGTYLGEALREINRRDGFFDARRLVIITDEQAQEPIGAPPVGRAYMMNVAPYAPAIGYGPWTRINGWSEAALSFIAAAEASEANP